MNTSASRRASVRPWSMLALAASVSLLSMAPARPARAEEIEFPETGTPAERTRQLWKASRTHILEDAKAALSDAEYQKRRGPIWGAWIRLQMETAGEADDVGRLIPDILGLLNRTYGWTADSPAKRQENRDESRPFTEKRVAEIDERVAALK